MRMVFDENDAERRAVFFVDLRFKGDDRAIIRIVTTDSRVGSERRDVEYEN